MRKIQIAISSGGATPGRARSNAMCYKV